MFDKDCSNVPWKVWIKGAVKFMQQKVEFCQNCRRSSFYRPVLTWKEDNHLEKMQIAFVNYINKCFTRVVGDVDSASTLDMLVV